MKEYPKIETLYDRDDRTRKVLPDKLRLTEFGLIRRWQITEKIDGTNVRIGLQPDGSVVWSGRTDDAQLHATLVDYLRRTFSETQVHSAFDKNADGTWPEVTIFGEGYGPKIQSGGSYRLDVAVRLFDLRIGRWWLERENVEILAEKLGVSTVPLVGTIDNLPRSADDLKAIIEQSVVAKQDGGPGCRVEGIVARTEPLLLTRSGERLMWKLKYRDFA